MFTTAQILTATEMIKDFPRIAKALVKQPQAMLIMQKSNEPLVLVNAKIFEDLVQQAQQPYYDEEDDLDDFSAFKSTKF